MKIEIERKFLLASERWRSLVERSEKIQDGLLATNDERKVRVRIIGDRSTLTVKTQRIRGQREEFEYDNRGRMLNGFSLIAAAMSPRRSGTASYRRT